MDSVLAFPITPDFVRGVFTAANDIKQTQNGVDFLKGINLFFLNVACHACVTLDECYEANENNYVDECSYLRSSY